MYKWQKNPDNKKFNTFYDGTVNMTTLLSAPVIGTKGHFYQLDPELINKTSIIQNHSGNKVQPDSWNDDTWLGIEKTSGLTL